MITFIANQREKLLETLGDASSRTFRKTETINSWRSQILIKQCNSLFNYFDVHQINRPLSLREMKLNLNNCKICHENYNKIRDMKEKGLQDYTTNLPIEIMNLQKLYYETLTISDFLSFQCSLHEKESNEKE